MPEKISPPTEVEGPSDQPGRRSSQSLSAGSDKGLPTRAEVDRLAELEHVVATGIATFVAVGVALAEIRDARLYRAGYGTFEAYLEDRWEFRKSQAYRMIEAANTVAILSPIGDTPAIANEAQARAIKPVLDQQGPAAAAVVLRRAAAEGPVTAASITRKAEAITVARVSPPRRTMTRPPRRQTLPAQFDKHLEAVRLAANALRRLTNDDRWNRKAPQIAGQRGSDLDRHIATLAAVKDALAQGGAR